MRALSARSKTPGRGFRSCGTPAAAWTSLAGVVLVLLAFGAGAAQLRSDAPETYVVQPGDTLWSIAGRFLEDPWDWQRVWRSNSEVSNPNRIYPGDVLRLSMVGGQPSVGVDRSGGRGDSGRGGIRTVKLSPRVRAESLEEAVPTIPMASIAPFLTQPYVAESAVVRKAPYVVGFPDEHIVAGLGDSVYVRRIDSTSDLRFQALRPGNALRDPKSNEILGYEAVFVANLTLQRAGDPAKLQVVRSEREVSIGDRVIPAAAEEPLANFYPKPAPAGLRGYILSVLNGVTQVGQYDVVSVNLGTQDGVEPGHVFEVFQGGRQERDQVRQGMFDHNWREEGPLSSGFWLGNDWKIRHWRANQPDANAPFPPTADIRRERSTFIKPFERSGVLMIFRCFERVSFGLVLDATRAMHIDDRLAPPPS